MTRSNSKNSFFKYFEPWEAIRLHNEYVQKLQDNREKSKSLNYQLKQKYKDKLPMKCIADEIWLYCRYLYDNVDELRYESNLWKERDRIMSYEGRIPLTQEEKKIFYNKLEDLYHRIRGETFYIGKKPSSIAAGLFYLACVVAGLNISQKSIMERVAISQQGIIKPTRLIKKHLGL